MWRGGTVRPHWLYSYTDHKRHYLFSVSLVYVKEVGKQQKKVTPTPTNYQNDDNRDNRPERNDIAVGSDYSAISNCNAAELQCTFTRKNCCALLGCTLPLDGRFQALVEGRNIKLEYLCPGGSTAEDEYSDSRPLNVTDVDTKVKCSLLLLWTLLVERCPFDILRINSLMKRRGLRVWAVFLGDGERCWE